MSNNSDFSLNQDNPRHIILLYRQKPILTPQKKPISAPNSAIAQILCQEWQAQKTTKQGLRPNPATMPNNQLNNSIIDNFLPHESAKYHEICEYAVNDAIFYLPNNPPQELVPIWRGHYKFAQDFFGQSLQFAPKNTIIMPSQPPAYQENIAAFWAKLDGYQRALLYYATIQGGSFLVAMQFTLGLLSVDDALNQCFLEQLTQAKYWGDDPVHQQTRLECARELNLIKNWLNNYSQFPQ